MLETGSAGMMIAVIGGNLQGVEAAYLSHKAGWEVMLIDRRPAPPAAALCDRFEQFNVSSPGETARLLNKADLVLPALENREALNVLTTCARAGDLPLAFDPSAYAVSSSKIRSNRVFDSLGIRVPVAWPGCGFPVMIKPDTASGSEGVRVIQRMADFPPEPDMPEKYVIQSYTPGPVYSLEVMGTPGAYRPMEVVALEMDAVFDCKRVVAPSGLSPDLVHRFEQMAVTLAEALRLKGLMDLEVILNDGRLVLLEIDARLPSQTPSAVYWSTGLNMMAEMGNLFLDSGKVQPGKAFRDHRPRAVIYEHIQVRKKTLAVGGEHLMSGASPVTVRTDFFGADEAVTNYRPKNDDWVATLIFAASDRLQVWEKRNAAIAAIRRHCRIAQYIDDSPGTGEKPEKRT
ncbi:MAG: 3-methylornithine--L-lysine ligase PylC [Deltaproteobacteria bacterium]|nr:MAG: 3-methylornithine--L-lysine ligase PylC [Deltaproteobacteria bacterium]